MKLTRQSAVSQEEVAHRAVSIGYPKVSDGAGSRSDHPAFRIQSTRRRFDDTHKEFRRCSARNDALLASFPHPPSPRRDWSKKGLPGILTAPEEAAIRPGLARRNGMTAHHRIYRSEELYHRWELPNPCANHSSLPFPEGMGSVR
jgi:hypothetical protein